MTLTLVECIIDNVKSVITFSMRAETGIRGGLRSRWINIRVGSIPIASTNIGRYPVIGSGADCKSAGLAVSGGSSPSLPTKKINSTVVNFETIYMAPWSKLFGIQAFRACNAGLESHRGHTGSKS